MRRRPISCGSGKNPCSRWRRRPTTASRSTACSGPSTRSRARRVSSASTSLQRTAHGLESFLQEVREGERPFDSSIAPLLFEGLDLCRSMIDAFTEERDAAVDTGAFLQHLACSAARARRSGRQGPAPQAAPAPAAAAPSSAARPSQRASCRSTSRGSRAKPTCAPSSSRTRLERIGPDPGRRSVPGEPQGRGRAVRLHGDSRNRDGAGRGGFRRQRRPGHRLPCFRGVTKPRAGRDGRGSGPGTTGKGLTARRGRAGVRVEARRAPQPGRRARHPQLGIRRGGPAASRGAVGKTPFVYDLEQKTEALSAITRDLQEGIMKARMLPVANVFNRFHRVVRDLSKASGKAVTLDVFGEETEIDKKVIDRIGEPLVHLIRNAVDHGIEPRRSASPPARSPRARSGSAPTRTATASASRCRTTAAGWTARRSSGRPWRRDCSRAEEAPRRSPERVFSFIFLPGFSTAERVSDISGRGVGNGRGEVNRGGDEREPARALDPAGGHHRHDHPAAHHGHHLGRARRGIRVDVRRAPLQRSGDPQDPLRTP